MEFKDLATKFEGLTADQVGVLAEFSKELFKDSDMFYLSKSLVGLTEHIFNLEDFDFEKHGYTISSLLHIVGLIENLNEQCWNERKTPFGLTGINENNDHIGLDNETKIIAS